MRNGCIIQSYSGVVALMETIAPSINVFFLIKSLLRISCSHFTLPLRFTFVNFYRVCFYNCLGFSLSKLELIDKCGRNSVL